jgi:hypothetical protein
MNRSILSLILISFFLIFNCNYYAQNPNLYVPLDIKKAYDNGTRSYDGKPGQNYSQNYSDYKIKAEILPDSSMLEGSEKITYHNNSTDTLRRIIMRLYHNNMSKGSAREWSFGTAELTDGIDIKLLVVEGDTLDVNDRNSGVYRSATNMYINLKNPLPPKGSLQLEVDWSVFISKIVRLRWGNYGDGEFFIAYWYPQIAVYDDIDGWDRIEYTGSVEFYNDFSNFDFEITVPSRSVIWATGELQNGQEVFQDHILTKIEKAKNSDETVNIINAEDYKNNFVTKDNEKNTWKFKAENVTDVSFCVSDSYVWDAASVVVDDETGRRVLTSVVYADSTVHYDEAAQFSRATIEYLSKELPGYPYPYPHVTSFSNGERRGGMETPMMANDSAPQDRGRHIGLIFHEISHSIFPFAMGTNERKYAWMDEGWATFLAYEVVDKYEPDYNYKSRTIGDYENSAGAEAELPMMIPSYSTKGSYVRTAFYSRPAAAYSELEQLLGRDLFRKALLEFMNRWNGKHEDLSWFWNPWFYEMGYPDLGIASVSQIEDDVEVTIEKIGNIPTRVELNLVFEDGTSEKITKSAREWINGNKTLSIFINSDKKINNITLGNSEIPDVNKKNNSKEI